MKNEIVKNLVAVLNALNSISVSGKANLGNLSGSIALIEQTVSALAECDIVPDGDDTAERA